MTEITGHILVVDDTTFSLRILTDMLSRQGYQAEGATSGKQALHLIDKKKPDLILLDINMPGMDGFEVCAILKEQEETRHIPIIFISALDDTQGKVKAFSLGAVDYITKPFQLREVVARVKTHLNMQNLKDQLHLQVEALQQANTDLDAYARMVAHDLKNPLGNLLFSLSLIQRQLISSENEQLHTLLASSMDNCHKMNEIVETLLLLSGVRQERVTYESLHMDEIIEQALSRLEGVRREHEGEIVLPDHWPTVQGQRAWVEEVWTNYISNGIKYGGRPFHLTLKATPMPNGFIQFSITDNGEGIDPEQSDLLFDEFTRFNQQQIEGHGLGLSIVRRIINRLGGEVGAENAPDGGATFYFTLPQE